MSRMAFARAAALGLVACFASNARAQLVAGTGAPPGEDAGMAEHDPEEGRGAEGPEAIELSAGFGVLNRNLSWNDGDLAGQGMSGYSLDAAPLVRVQAITYPGAFVSKDALARAFGLRLGFQHSLGTDSTGSGASFPTTNRQFDGGVRGRALLGPLWGWLELGGGAHAFILDDADDPTAVANIPDVQYRFVSASLGIDWPLEALRVGAHAGYRHLLGHGEIGDSTWFPRLSGPGWNAGATVAFALPSNLELGLAAEATLYAFDLKPEPPDDIWASRRAVAGGAEDRYLSALVHVGWRH